MLYELCYELIKGTILIIILHYLFLYLKNLFMEVYEFNPSELSLSNFIKPVNKNNNIITFDNIDTKNISISDDDVNTTSISSIIEKINNNNIDKINDIKNTNNNRNSNNDNSLNIKDELLQFINAEEFDDTV